MPPVLRGSVAHGFVLILGAFDACGGGNAASAGRCVGAALPPSAVVAAVSAPQPTPSDGSCPAGMAALPGGTFTMGDRKDSVTVQPFCMDVTEVTVAAYASCADAGRCSPAATAVDWPDISDADRIRFSPFCNGRCSDRSNHPINCVDWGQSGTYCRAQGKRLPTEEEWEWAAQGGSQGRVYPWGNEAPGSQLCWHRLGTCPVGTFPDGDAPGGINDLAGNVWEWTSSRFDTSASSSYNAGASYRVNRGAGWITHTALGVRAAGRYASPPTFRDGLLVSAAPGRPCRQSWATRGVKGRKERPGNPHRKPAE